MCRAAFPLSTAIVVLGSLARLTSTKTPAGETDVGETTDYEVGGRERENSDHSGKRHNYGTVIEFRRLKKLH